MFPSILRFLLPALPVLVLGYPHVTGHAVQAEAGKSTDKAVHDGIQFLLKTQRSEGSWWDGLSYGKIHEYGGCTALVMLALRSHKSVDPKGVATAIEKAKRYLLQHLKIEPAQIGPNTDGRYWTYAFSLIGLVRLYQDSPDAETKAQIEKLIDALCKGQIATGAYVYHASVGPASSLTACCLLALLEAREAGFAVPEDAVKKPIQALKTVRTKTGTFFYKTSSTRDASGSKLGSAARNPGNELALLLAGQSDKAKLDWASGNFMAHREYLEKVAKKGANTAATHIGKDLTTPYYYFYGCFFTVQALLFSDKEAKIAISADDATQTKSPAEGIKIIQEAVLALQRKDGSWRDSLISEDKYGTALALMILNSHQLYGLKKK